MDELELKIMRDALDACANALSLIPIKEIAAGLDWHPSETAIYLINNAIDLVEAYLLHDPS